MRLANKDIIINSDMEIEHKAMALLMCAAQERKAEMERLISGQNLSLLQLTILHGLDKSPTGVMTVGQLKSIMIDDSPNVSRTLNKLVAQGYITKERSEEDQRTVFISITEDGRAAHRSADEELLKMGPSSLSKDDYEKLYELLLKL
ncbi:transcriptional regulator, SarA/Rot family [Pseudovibrio denitrificans]|uniref:transcriptional regulator, SarA/Rot family n=1 Tax=Pseudovibrio denitrificans TaxID=258256 RepID=UPI0006D12577|nr:MarR family transcriptional regulator [Pseudovibrio denitrificans]